MEFLFQLHERALRELPRCYKIWHNYLKLRVGLLVARLCHQNASSLFLLARVMLSLVKYSFQESYVEDVCVTDPACDVVEACYARAVCVLGKMPRIWEEYIEHLTRRLKITSTRHVGSFDSESFLIVFG